MDKRALLAIALSFLVVAAWSVIFAPRPRPLPAPAPAEQGPAKEAVEPPAPAPAATGGETAPAGAEAVAAPKREEFIVDTETYALRFANEGGRILSWRLHRYVDELKAPLELVSRDATGAEEYPLRLTVSGDDAATKLLDRALFLHEERDAGEGDWPGGGFTGRVVTFTWADGRGLKATKRLAISRQGYVNHAEALIERDGRPVKGEITWAVGLPEASSDTGTRYFHTQDQGVVQIGGTHRFPAKLLTERRSFAGADAAGGLLWGGLESTYFASLVLPEKPEKATLSLVPVATPAAAAGAAPAHPLIAARVSLEGPTRFVAVVGPKDYDLLAGLDRDLDHAIDYSRFSLIYAVTRALYLALRWLNGFIGNYGISIVLLTIAIRTALFPLTYRSAISMRQNAKKMGRIQPRVKAIQERYRKMKKSMETQRQMNDDIMEVYRKEGMNPMGSVTGCLPLLLQMPVFIAFYNLLAVTIELRGAPFLFWIHDLSQRDPTWITPILMGISWVVQQWMTSATIADPVQRKMMYMMPVIFTMMMVNMPSGLVIYWLVSNIMSLVQQYAINKKADAMPEVAA